MTTEAETFSKDIQRIEASLAEHNSLHLWKKTVRNSLHVSPTNNEQIVILQKYIIENEIRLHRFETDYPNNPQYYEEMASYLIRENERHTAKIADLQDAPESNRYSLKWTKNSANAILYGNSTEPIAINEKEGLFATRNADGTLRVVKRLCDLGYEDISVRINGELVHLY